MTERLDDPRLSTAPLIDLTALGWQVPDAGEELLPSAPTRLRLMRRPSRAADVLGAFHASTVSPAAMVADFLLLALAAALMGVGTAWSRALYPLAVVAVGYLSQLYADRDSVQTRGLLWFPALLVTPVTAVAAVSIAAHVMPVEDAAALAAIAFGALTGSRLVSWLCLSLLRRRGLGLRPTLIVGPAEGAGILWRRLVEFPEVGLRPTQLLSYPMARTPGVIERELRRWGIEHVVLVAPSTRDVDIAACLPLTAVHAPYFSVVPALAELFIDPRSITEVGGIPLIPLGRPTRLRQRFPGKRAFDVAASSLLLVLTLPLLAAVAVAVKLGDGGPVFFRQPRVGRDGEVFPILKFRTMVEGADTLQHHLAGFNVTDGLLFKLQIDPRVTPLGRFLRRTSLDELPQLWNVFRGEMSMVGPRPLAVEPHEFSAAESGRHRVLPGITGYWQLSGGNGLTYAEMIRLDLAYIRNWSLWLDLCLLLRTVPALLHRHGAS